MEHISVASLQGMDTIGIEKLREQTELIAEWEKTAEFLCLEHRPVQIGDVGAAKADKIYLEGFKCGE